VLEEGHPSFERIVLVGFQRRAARAADTAILVVVLPRLRRLTGKGNESHEPELP